MPQPPPVLALHLNRSLHFGTYASKNNARVHFPEVLDLTPFTTSGMLSTSPSFPISSHLHTPSPSAAVAAAAAASLATQTTKERKPAPQPPRVLYRLAAVVCHYGQHSFGHYVCFRRKPRGAGRVGPPRLDEGLHAVHGRGWLRASDDAVREVGIETVLQEGSGAFMLYYERVRNEDKPGVSAWSPHSRAADDDDDDDVGEIGGGGVQQEKPWRVKCESEDEVEMDGAPVIKARVVRSVSLGRGDDFEGAPVSVLVKQEAEEGEGEGKWDGDADSEARLLRPSSSAVSAEAPSPIPDAPAVDEPPIEEPVDH